MVTMHFHIAQNELMFRNIFSHSAGGGGRKRFGTNEKLSLGYKVGQIRFCGIGYPISVLLRNRLPGGIPSLIALLCTS